MTTSREWRDAAVIQRGRADQAQRRAEAFEHALNLLLNNQLIEFHTAMTADGAIHDFSYGIARNVLIGDPIRKMFSQRDDEDFSVVLWTTRFEPNGIYANVYEPRELSTLAEKITDQPALKSLIRDVVLAMEDQFPELRQRPQLFEVSRGAKPQ